MPRKKGMMGPGSAKMGGAGIKPSTAPTPMAGRPPMSAPGGMPSLGGGGPRPPMGGPSPGGQAVARSPAAGMGGAAGFNRGGHVESEKTHEEMHKKRERHEKLAHGGEVGASSAPKPREAFAKGGVVGGGGGDTKGRVGRDRGGAGKAC